MAQVTAIEYGTRSRVTVAPRYALCLLLLLLCITNSNSATITGTVSNSESGQPLSRVTVLVEGSGRSMPCNDVGQYRLLLDPGLYRLKFSHVSHNSEWFEIEVADTNIVLDVSLRPAVIQLSGMTVYKDKYNPAQRIILKAIARKKAILSQLQSYQCKAYTKQTVLDPDTGGAASVKGIVESQIECFWEQPNKYKEIIVARKQTSNVMAELNTLSIEEIPNFNMNRIQYGIYSIVSPTADDALKYYNYFLLDTIFIDGNPVFRLEVEPKKEFDPLVRGTIDIADSTFAVVGGDGYPTKGASMPGMKSIQPCNLVFVLVTGSVACRANGVQYIRAGGGRCGR